MKSEIKVELNSTQSLTNLIQEAYFSNGQMGKIDGKNHHLQITPEVDDIFYTVIKGLDRATIKVTNPMIDGTLRCVVEDREELRIYPINTYCIVDETNKKYSFY
jgi:hypothetical protein